MPSPLALLARVPVPAVAALLMLVAALGFAGMNVIMRHLSQTMSPLEIAFFRNLFGLAVMLPVFLRTGSAVLRTHRHGLFFLRGTIHTAASWLWVYSLAFLPVDQATALNFTVPIWATIGAAIILRETVAPQRWAATVIGLAGSLIIIRPGVQAFDPVLLLPLGAALGMGANMLVVKVLSRTESPTAVVIYMNLYMTLFSAGPAFLVWRWPTPWELALSLLMGALASLSHLLTTRAFALVDASVAAPFDLGRLVFGAMLGYAFFGELMDSMSWLGAAVIFAATFYMIRTESRDRSA